jgi:pyridoxal phosphate enzyme (YggS family)
MNKSVAQNLQLIRQRIRIAASGSLLGCEDAQLIAVSKGQTAERIISALEAGQRVFGENRVQEASEKWHSLRKHYPDTQLHLIGPLQTNKVKDALAVFDVIQTLDRPKLADAVAAECDRIQRPIPCFIQVNIGEEVQKSGISPNELVEFTDYCCKKLQLNVVGLMCIPPQDVPAAQYFGLLRHLAAQRGLRQLSMGMSNDYETALRFGATHVRVGTALFGERQQH